MSVVQHWSPHVQGDCVDAAARPSGAALLNAVVERVYGDLKNRMPRPRVHELAARLMAGYRNPTVTAYIPVLLQRRLRTELEAELRARHGHPASGL